MTTGDEAAFSLRSVRRRLLSGSAWVLGAKVTSLLLGIVVTKILTELMSTSDYGVYTSAFTLSLLGAAIAQMGLDRAVVRFVAGAIGAGEPGRARAAIKTALTYGSMAAVVLGAIAALGPGQMLARSVFDSPDLAKAMPLVAGWLIATAVQSLMVESFRGMSRFAAATLLDAFFVDLVSASSFALVFVLARHTGPLVVISIAAGATGLAAAVGGVLLLRRIRSLRGPGELERSEMFHVAWPLMVTNLAILLLGSGVDVLVLNAFRPEATVGLYGVSSRLVVFVATPFAIFSGVIPPIIAELHTQGKMRQLERALRAGATLAGLPAFGALLIFVFFGPWVLQFFGHNGEYRDGAPILAILSAGRLVAVWAGSAGITLMMTGHQKAMMKITLMSGVVSVAAGVAGAYYHGAIGVACATAGAQVLQNAIQLTLVRRRLGIWTMIHFSPRELYRYLRPGGQRGAAEDAAERVAEALVEPDESDEDEAPQGD
jgi:O-antigen/teichoic acid export membrane protein